MAVDIELFDIHKGIYLTRIDNFKSDFHSHPAIEIISAEIGDFDLLVNNTYYKKIKFAAINANKLHKVLICNSNTNFLLIEDKNKYIENFFNKNGIMMNDGFYSCYDN
jgi:hypothetical protein